MKLSEWPYSDDEVGPDVQVFQGGHPDLAQLLNGLDVVPQDGELLDVVESDVPDRVDHLAVVVVIY